MNKKAKIVVCGCTELGWEIIKHLVASNIHIDHIVTISPQKASDQKVSGYCDLSQLAELYNIPCYTAEKYSLKSEKDAAFFKDQQFDILIQGGWQRLFPDHILETLTVGAVGVHGSADFLPKGRGRSPINWSLIEGKKRFIFHFFIMKPGADDGDIFHYEIVDINEWDDCNTVYYKNALVTGQVLTDWIPKLISGDYKLYKQEGEPTYYPKRSEADGEIDWKKTVFDIYNFIRALTKPYPGAYSYINGEKITIWKAQPFDSKISFFQKREGEVVKVYKNGNLVINCNSGLLLVTEYDFTGDIFDNDIISSL